MAKNTTQAALTLRETRRRLLVHYQDVDRDIRRSGTDLLRHYHGGRKGGLRTALDLIDQLLAENADMAQSASIVAQDHVP
jgi:hypothetical protein